MHVGTDDDVLRLLSDSKWNSAIRVGSDNLYYDVPEASCLELRWPTSPGRAAYFTRKASRLGLDGDGDAARFQGALLWVTFSELGSLAPTGWKLVEKMRQRFGENRPLQTARAHFFRSDELVDLTAFVLPCFTMNIGLLYRGVETRSLGCALNSRT